MKLENYQVYLPNYSIGDKIYGNIGPVCESYGKTVLVIGGKKALAAAFEKIEAYTQKTNLVIIGTEIYGENCTYAAVETPEKPSVLSGSRHGFCRWGRKGTRYGQMPLHSR